MSETNALRRMFSGLTGDSWLLAFSSFFADISSEMLYPVLPIFLTQVLKASGTVVGLVDGCAQAAQNLVQGFSGAVSDRLQRRKSVALVGYLLAAISKPMMGLAASWQALLGARLLDRLGAGSRSPARDALIAGSVEAANRGRAFGLEGLGDNAGACLGPLLAVFLLYSLHLGLRPVFYLAIIPGLLAFLLVLLVRERPTPPAAGGAAGTGSGRFPPQYWTYLRVTAVFGLGNSSNAFLILRTRDIGASLETTILIYAGFNLVAALISYPAGSLSDKLGRRTLLLTGYIVFFCAYLGFALGTHLVLIGALFVFYGAYQGIYRVVGKSMAADFVPASLRASGIGWYNTTVGMLQLVASLVAGLLWDRMGHWAVFAYGAVCALCGALALLFCIPAPAAGRPGLGAARR